MVKPIEPPAVLKPHISDIGMQPQVLVIKINIVVNITIIDTDVVNISVNMNQSVTFVKILIQMNVRIYSYQQNYTNEYPNIFILICLTRTNVRISICTENCMNI